MAKPDNRVIDFLIRRGPQVAASLLIVVLAMCLWLASQFFSRMEWVQHTRDVRDQLATLDASLVGAESSQRGYLLTKDQGLLDDYQGLARRLPPILGSLEGLLRDNPVQTRRLAEVEPLIAERLSLLKSLVERVERGEAVTAGPLLRGKAIMDEVRERIAVIAAEEDKLLVERTESSRLATVGLASAALAAALVSGLIVYGWARSLQKSQSELMKAMSEREAEEAKVRQLQKMEAVGQLTGGIAHDFNNMLGVVIGALGLAQKRLSKGDADVGKLIDGALDGANRAANLTRRLLAFSRQQPLEPRPVVANAMISGMAELVSRTLGETISTETVLGAGLWTIHADPSLLENAILNLCVNARDAMPEGGKLTIETANTYLDEDYARAHDDITAGQYVMIAVSDTGTGMPPEIIARAFDPFFTTKETGKGTGLGLSQVHGFVKQSKGHIKIYSEAGEGTAVKMYFPRLAETLAHASDAAEPRRNVAAGASPAGRLVLVVEDDPRVRETSLSLLKELGYETMSAQNAAEALRRIEETPDIALLFTDIVMPETNGRQLADAALKRRPGLKVLYTTGFTRNAIVHSGTLDPGVHLVQKPFTIDQLADKLAAVFGAGKDR